MEGKTGFRHVQLKSYDPQFDMRLRGEKVDEAKEEEFRRKRRMMYADFESSIDPESGEHKFMSFGCYDYKDDDYMCGYTLEKFFDFVLDKAYSSSEDQV